MKLKDLIVADAIVADLKATDREGVIRELVQSLAACGSIDPTLTDEIVASVLKRELSGSTGFGKGVAVPHSKHPKVKKLMATIGRSATGVDFGALDHQPVFMITLLLSPESQPELHFQAMNAVFTNLQKDTFRKFLRQCDTRQKIVDLLAEADSGKL